MPGDLTYTREKFVTAADSMATSEATLRERFLDAYRSEAMHGASLRAGAGPPISDDLADRIRLFAERMTAIDGPGGSIAVTIASMSDAEVHDAAAELTSIARELDAEWYRQ